MSGPITHGRAGALAAGELLARYELPAVSMTQLAFYCAAVGVTDPIHYDRQAAGDAGFPGVPVNGSLRIAWVASAVGGIAAAPNRIVSIACRHKGSVYVGQRELLEVHHASYAAGGAGPGLLRCTVTGTVDGQVVDVGEAVVQVAAGTDAGNES